jgi:starvation-inducible outer membrane lipoprotein
VTATPAELVKPFESYVAAQANRLVEPYIGKWIRLSATVVNVHNQATFWQVLMYRAVGIGTPDNPQISALFEPEWSDRLSTITLHQSITIIGRIQQVERITVSLAECELV